MTEQRIDRRPNHHDRSRRTSIACPHCLGPTRVRSSRDISRTTRELFLFCPDIQCGASYRAVLEIQNGISPSACPDPDVRLRMAPPRPRAANDDEGRAQRAGSPGGPEVPPAARRTAL